MLVYVTCVPHFYLLIYKLFLKKPRKESLFSIFANFLITGHLLFAVVIIQNPIAQLVESWFGVEDFGIKRIGIRTLISFTCKSFLMGAIFSQLNSVLVCGLSCPKFDFIMGIIGSAFVMCNTYIFPSVFYLL